MSKFTNVYYLEDSDFQGNKLIGFQNSGFDANKPVICMVFADWCGYCKTTKPEYQKLANKVAEMKEPYYVACIQADDNSESVQKLAKKLKDVIPGFQGFPHILKFVDGKPAGNFDGQRTMEGFMSFM